MTAGTVAGPRHGANHANPSAPLRMLRARARQFLSAGLPACLARADDNLFELANAAQDTERQIGHLDALSRWQNLRPELPAKLLAACDAAFATPGGAARASPAADPAGEGLVSDDELDEIVAVDAMAAAATKAIGDGLPRLLERVAALCGATPTARDFPLAPQFIVTSLLREISSLPPPARRAILSACEATLLKSLPEAVMWIDRLLDQLGVAPPASNRLRAGAGLAIPGPEPAALDASEQEQVQLLDALFAELAATTWVPPALGELLAAAELPVRAMARTAPEFLTTQLHPGRRLLQEIIIAATDLMPATGYAEQELFRRARAALDALAEPGADAPRLAGLLVEVASLADRERERQERRAIPTLREASARERTDMAHARALRTLESRVNGRRLPLTLIDLLERGWCRVLYDAWLHQGEQSPGWREAVHLLDQLIGLLGDAEPGRESSDRLLETLITHLATSMDPREARRLVESLRPCLNRATEPNPALPSPVLTPAEARELGDGRLLVIAAGLELVLPGNPASIIQELAADFNEIDLGRVDALRPGGWVEFHEPAGSGLRARFVGVVQPGDTHVFADAEGSPVRRLPRLRLALALRDGEVFPLDNTQFFERALARARNTGAPPP